MKVQLRQLVCASALAASFFIAPSLLGPNTAFAQGPSPEGRAVVQSLSDEERQKFFAMPPEEKRAFIQKKLAEKSGGASAAKGKARGGAAKGGKGGFKGKGGFGGRGKGKGKGGRRFPPPLIELAQVTREALVQTYTVTGRLVASNRSAIASTIRGRVAEVLVQVGDRVKKGDVLVRLDLNRLKLEADLKAAEVIGARAKWNNAKAQVNFLNQELARLERLKRSAAFSQARFEDKQQEVVKAQTTVDETAAALRRARASRDLARVDVKDAEIKAPFDGAIIIRHTSPGAYINTGNPVITILDDVHLEIEADVPSVRLAGVRPASTITVKLDDKRSIQAKVRAIIPDENPLARTQAVRLVPDFGNNSGNVVPNQSVVLMVPRGDRRQVIAVPKDAIVERQNGKAVFIFANGRVRPATVQIGESFGSKFEILSGLRPGQQIVVRGNELLRPGQQVRVSRRGNRGGAKGGGSGGRKGGGGIVSTLSPEERQKFFAMSPDERRAFIAKKRATTASAPPASKGGGKGKRGGIVSTLSPEERQKFFAMSTDERRAFIQKKRAEADSGGAPQASTVSPPPQSGRPGGFGGKGKGGGLISRLSPEERQKFFAMPPEERRAFIQKKRQELQGQ